MTKTLKIVGSNVRDIASFYDEINRVFMADEDWRLGESLDALDDMLWGGYGAIAGEEHVSLIWEDMESCRSVLGVAAMRAHLLGKLEQPEVFDGAAIGRQLEELEAAGAPTYFDIVLEIIAEHRNVNLVPG
jgi:hypothetical protein